MHLLCKAIFLETPLFIKLLIWVFVPRFFGTFSISALSFMNLLLWQTYPIETGDCLATEVGPP